MNIDHEPVWSLSRRELEGLLERLTLHRDLVALELRNRKIPEEFSVIPAKKNAGLYHSLSFKIYK